MTRLAMSAGIIGEINGRLHDRTNHKAVEAPRTVERRMRGAGKGYLAAPLTFSHDLPAT